MSGNEAKTKILLIVGPTAVGKTECAVRLANVLDGEIVNADSMQVYRGMDIGTAKPTVEEQKAARFHLIDAADPDQTFSAGAFVEMGRAAIDEIAARGKTPIVCGGTGLYCKTLLSGIVKTPAADREFRERMMEMERSDSGAMMSRLMEIDPVRAAQLSPNDHLRIVRALEIHHLTGKRMSDIIAKHDFLDRKYLALKIGLHAPEQVLLDRIISRTDRMFEQGWISEVRSLKEKGYGPDLPSMKALGYIDIFRIIDGALSLEEAKTRIVQTTRKFSKKQRTWFRADKEIQWFEYPENFDVISLRCSAFFA